MNARIRSSALLLCLALGWAIPVQAAERGWYVVGFGGQTSASISQGRTDEGLVTIFESVGLDVTDLTSTIDDSGTGYGLAGGNQFNDHFALEFAYVDVGSVEYRASATVTDGVNVANADVDLESSAHGPILSALGILPIGERFSVFGRVGFSFLSAKGTARVTIDDTSDRDSQDSQKSDPVLGVGVEYSVGRYSAVRLSWDRYFDVGTDDVTGDVDADMYSLGFRLGVGWFN
jgi:OmpA-OmpF porin, OOP family